MSDHPDHETPVTPRTLDLRFSPLLLCALIAAVTVSAVLAICGILRAGHVIDGYFAVAIPLATCAATWIIAACVGCRDKILRRIEDARADIEVRIHTAREEQQEFNTRLIEAIGRYGDEQHSAGFLSAMGELGGRDERPAKVKSNYRPGTPNLHSV